LGCKDGQPLARGSAGRAENFLRILTTIPGQTKSLGNRSGFGHASLMRKAIEFSEKDKKIISNLPAGRFDIRYSVFDNENLRFIAVWLQPTKQ